MEVCGVRPKNFPVDFFGFGFQPESHVFQYCILGFGAMMLVILGLVKFIKNRRASRYSPRLVGEEVSSVVNNAYGSITRGSEDDVVVHKAGDDSLGERQFVEGDYFPDHPRWIL